MNTENKDILKDHISLKQMPFSVPEGYFETFKGQMHKPATVKVSFWSRIVPYCAVAAVFIFLVSVGTFVLEQTTSRHDMTQEDYILFSDNLMNIIESEDNEQYAAADMADEDIINYLIYSGISAEEIELVK